MTLGIYGIHQIIKVSLTSLAPCWLVFISKKYIVVDLILGTCGCRVCTNVS